MLFSRRDPALKVCALGFDARSYTALQLFFKGKCADKAALVGEDEADVCIIDMDAYNGPKTLAEQQAKYPKRPLLLLSLEERDPQPNAIHIKKPVQIQSMLTALDEVRGLLSGKTKPAPKTPPRSPEPSPPPKAAPEPPPPAEAPRIIETAPKHIIRSFASREDHLANQAAMQLDDRGFGDYIGSLKDIDPRNPLEVKAAQYDPKRHLQGYLQSACKTALTKNCAIRLNTGWKPITIFPQSREVWIDADDQQLRSFCLVPVHSIADLGFTDSEAGVMTISPASTFRMRDDERDQSKLQRMDALIWKVALWTSAGRVPDDIDLNRPVYLRNWPNFTRLLVFPHALRIAALLSEQPYSLLDVAETLNIRQQYVFAFFSAARALGLADQTSRQSESLIAPSPIEPRKNAGLLKKILNRLLKR